jgi:hypothetical protein
MHSSFRPAITVWIALLLTLGCTSGAIVDILRLEPRPRPPTKLEAVQVLAMEPTRPYVAVALVSVSAVEREDALKARFIAAAAHLGGDAVILDAHSLSRDGSSLVLSGKVITFGDSTEQRRGSN